MEGEPHKFRLKMGMELDRISNLPSDVIDQILSSLPIRVAARTSVLSRQWRYIWATLSNLVFDCDPTENYAMDRIVDHVLLNHIDPISKFDLSHHSSYVDRWILNLSRNSIKEFMYSTGDDSQLYKMHSSFYSCQDMIHFDLSQCLLKPPPTFRGFKSLKSLDIYNVNMSDDAFEHMVACCPLLESLALAHCYFGCVKINAPKLQLLDIDCQLDDLALMNTSSLSEVIIDRFHNAQRQLPFFSNLLRIFAHLPQIQWFRIDRHSIKYFSVGVGLLRGKLPNPCLHLRYIFMRLSFYKMADMLTALCLLRSSPALEELEMWQDDWREREEK